MPKLIRIDVEGLHRKARAMGISIRLVDKWLVDIGAIEMDEEDCPGSRVTALCQPEKDRA